MWIMYYKKLYPSRQPEDFQDYLNKLKDNLREHGRFDALVGLGFTSKKEREMRLKEVSAPSLVIMGSKDPFWPDPEAEARYIARSLSAEMVMIDGAGH